MGCKIRLFCPVWTKYPPQSQRQIATTTLYQNRRRYGESILGPPILYRYGPYSYSTNDIPRILAVRGYIDDTTLAGDAVNPSWCAKAWSTLMALHSAGIVIEHHSCWRAAEVRMHPTDQVIDIPVTLQSIIHTLPGYHTARDAIIAACSYQHSLLISRDDKCIVVAPSEVRRIIHGRSNVLFQLYSLQCACSTKTALLTNCTWQEPLACALDTANIGAHLLTDG